MIEPGTTFAGYVIERRLGAGGMGEVYVGRHPRLPRSDAIKVLGAQVSGDAQYRARFQREAELAASLAHPAIVPVHDQGEDDGRLWISMQLIDGTDVAKLAAAGPIPVPEVARIISTVADALDFAGARGLVHRDVKPANILVSAAGHVMLTDFGIARMGAEASDLTGTGVTVGTLNYASPEQLRADAVDTRSDQYSLAATAYHLLAGVPPFAGTNAVQVISGHLSSPVPPLSSRRGGLPASVDDVLARGMAKDAAQRFGSSREFAAALQTALLAPHSDVTLQAAPVPYAMPTIRPALPTQPSPVPVDPVDAACQAALRARDALDSGVAARAELELDGLRDALVRMIGARTGAPAGQLLTEDRDRVRATEVSKRTFAGLEKAFASAVGILDDELRAVAPDTADAVSLPLLEEIARKRTDADRAGGRASSRALLPRGNWLVSAAVIALSAIVFLGLEGVRGARFWAALPVGLPWSAVGLLITAIYLVATANTVVRRLSAGGVVILAAAIWVWSDYSFLLVLSNWVSAGLTLLTPLAWGLGRRRGLAWLWSLVAGFLFGQVAGLVAHAAAYVNGVQTEHGWIALLIIGLIFPILVTGLLGWLIDWLRHRREVGRGAPSNPGTAPFDPSAPTQLRG
ncbi:hypothetical protein GCM10009648_12500 [Tsukamurella spumae]